ncbi:MAG: NAD(P)-dependent glycerol-3-phosphate dehydrogenase [Betaproteobacteria bacterium]|nr:NAD(P)-dependent glycerol-3-phosphate dehydrogenase [Betaproteobacteria bacterium]
MKIAILGAGAWGTALALSFSTRHHCTLWGRNPADLAEIAAKRCNERYLPGIALADALVIEADLAKALGEADLALIATTTSGLGEAAQHVYSLRPGLPIIWACKGFNLATGELPHETLATITAPQPAGYYGALSGPSFAREVAQGLPTALTLACNDFDYAKQLSAALSSNSLRVYSNPDLIGVELGGALKNVMAIAAGLCDGMSLGNNARAALITRSLAEIVRLGVAMGGRAETFMGLTGLGDLILTATGDLSRNRSVGVQLARGATLSSILASLGHVAEGVNSAQTALTLAQKHGIDMPITGAVCAVLFQQADPRETVKRLLARDPKAE